MTFAGDVAVFDLRPLDGRVIVEVYKLLTKLLGPDLSLHSGSSVSPSGCPFSLTISVPQNQNPTHALLKLAAAAYSADNDALDTNKSRPNAKPPQAAVTSSAIEAPPIPSSRMQNATARASSTENSAPIPPVDGQNADGPPPDGDEREPLPPAKRRRTNESFALHTADARNDVAKVAELLSKN
ncbi:hypothetical protein HDU96_006093 [Phlyctochytrium bullatum]|nr:hypothetical protein HDU96_006093 [Phlyctochytrium bullatum]